MDKRRRKGRVEIRVDWDNTTGGEWHYVPQSALTLLPSHRLEAGGRVSLKWRGTFWTGTIAPKRNKKMTSDQLKRGEFVIIATPRSAFVIESRTSWPRTYVFCDVYRELSTR